MTLRLLVFSSATLTTISIFNGRRHPGQGPKMDVCVPLAVSGQWQAGQVR